MALTQSQASRQLQNVRRLGLMSAYKQASEETGLPLSLLLAKDSRESRLGLALNSRCHSPNGREKGISQIHPAHWGFARTTPACNHKAYVKEGARILANEISKFSRVRSGLAAYNAGEGSVRSALQSGQPVDSVTTGKDYSRDVMSRKRVFDRILSASDIKVQGASMPLTLALVAAGIGIPFAIQQYRK